MLFKIILVFLLAMVLVGMIGKVLFPTALDRASQRAKLQGHLRRRFGGLMGGRVAPASCPRCGRPLIGKSCDCTKKG